MSYNFISDLPPQVQQVLTVELQELWLASYKAALTLGGSEGDAYQTAWLKVFQASFPGEIASIPSMTPPAPAVTPVQGTTPVSMGYWVDLKSVTLNDDGVTWLQAMPLGTYHHPVHGEIEITPERCVQFATNIKNNVRDIALDIDYDHKAKTTEAAGWVKDAEARASGLWLAVEFTKNALTKIKDKAYRYFSPEFSDTWTHPKTNQTYKDVLFGGALTNRPFLKDILPINMSEVIEAGGYMLEELIALLGLPADATEADVVAAVKAAKAEESGEGEGGTGTTNNPPQPAGIGVAASESKVLTPEVKTLAETDPVVKALADRIVQLEGATRLQDVNIKLSELAGPGKKYALAPTAADKIRTIALEAPVALGDKVLDIVDSLLTDGLVELGERGNTQPTRTVGGNESDSATKQFSDLVDAKVKEEKMDYATASTIVASENPELFETYRDEAFMKERGA